MSLWLKYRPWILACIFLAAIGGISFINRGNFTVLFGAYSVAFFTYVLLIGTSGITFSQKKNIAIAAAVISLFTLPNLSIDFYRFLWDGEIQWLGINPFDYKPEALIERKAFQESSYLQHLYTNMGELSQRHYSCYPTVKQVVFAAAAGIGETVYSGLLALKLINLGVIVAGAIYLHKLLHLLGLNRDRMFLLFLNPLWIIEIYGNIHFEGSMISLVFIALYYLLSSKLALGSVALALAVHVKLTPLMLLPFFYRFLGASRALLVYAVTIGCVIIIALPYLNPENIRYFFESLSLYFKAFEFNSSVFYYYIQYGRWEDGWNKIRYFGPRLSRLTIMAISVLSLYGQIPDWRSLFKRITIAFFIYLLLSSTIHPWYILVPLALSIFTEMSFALLWSFLVFLSYFAYSSSGTHDSYLRLLIGMEYLCVIAVLVIELYRKRPVFKRFAFDQPTNQSLGGTGS